jgi:hypothetical protein
MAYNDNEARDQSGKWTSGGGGGASATPGDKGDRPQTEAELALSDDEFMAKQFRDNIDEVAAKLNFDPAMISVTTEPKQFSVNGTLYNEGGNTKLADKSIEIRQGPYWTKPSVQGVTAHEIMHAKFQTFLDDYQAEYKKMTDATSHLDVDQYMKPNGELKGDWKEQFPLYETYRTVMEPSITDDYAKSDGITKYSEDYWNEWKAGKIGTSLAMHETLAEMARLHFEQGKIVAPPGIKKGRGKDADGKPMVFLTSKYPSKSWTALYKAVDNHWNETHK